MNGDWINVKRITIIYDTNVGLKFLRLFCSWKFELFCSQRCYIRFMNFQDFHIPLCFIIEHMLIIYVMFVNTCHIVIVTLFNY